MTLSDVAFSLSVIGFIAIAIVYGGKIFGGESRDVKKP